VAAASAGFLLDLLFGPKDRGDIIFKLQQVR
jgi:hypothetical protein